MKLSFHSFNFRPYIFQEILMDSCEVFDQETGQNSFETSEAEDEYELPTPITPRKKAPQYKDRSKDPSVLHPSDGDKSSKMTVNSATQTYHHQA